MAGIAKFGALCILLLLLACNSKRRNIPYEQIIAGSLELPHIKEQWGSQMFTGKLPLIVEMNEVVSKEYKVEVFGYPVEFLTSEEISGRKVKVYIEFTSIEYRGDEIRVEYEFPVRGAFAGAIFTDKGDGVWAPDWIKTGYY